MKALEPPCTPDDSLDDEAPQPISSRNPTGLSKVSLYLQDFLGKPFDDQRKEVDQSWLELAAVLPRKAINMALTSTKKESKDLQSLVTAAAIAKDKRFPSDDNTLTIKVPARLLGAFQAAIVIKGQNGAGKEAVYNDTHSGIMSLPQDPSIESKT